MAGKTIRESRSDGAHLEAIRENDQLLILAINGTVSLADVEHLHDELRGLLPLLDEGQALRLDGSGVKTSDSSVAGFIAWLEEECRQREIRFEIESLDTTTEAIRKLVGVDEKDLVPTELVEEEENPIERLGEYAISHHADFRYMVEYIGRIVLMMVVNLTRPWTIRWGEVIRLIQRSGAEALPIIGLLSTLVGLVIAFSAAVQLKQFGANIYVANLIGIGVARELGPLIAAIIVTGRSGSAFAAEIGTMKVSDEVDALIIMGVKPIDYLVMPRIIAVMIALPILTLFSDFFGIFGGMLIAITSLDITPLAFVQQLQASLGLWDVAFGVLKSFVFGIIIAGVGCYRGLETSGGALGVGKSTTESVVSGIFLVIVADAAFVIINHYLGLGLT